MSFNVIRKNKILAKNPEELLAIRRIFSLVDRCNTFVYRYFLFM